MEALGEADQAKVAERIDDIVAAGSDCSLWREIPARLAAGWPGVQVLLEGRSSQEEHTLGALCHGFDPDWMASYEHYYHAVNPWLPIMQQLPVLKASLSDETLPWSAITHTEFYNDFLCLQPESEHGAGMKLVDEDGRFAWLHFQYGHTVADQYNRALPRVLQTLAPAFRAALDLNREVAAARAWADTGRAALEAFAAPAVIANAKGRLRHANSAAAAALECGDLMRLDSKGHLRFSATAATNALLSRLATLRGPGWSIAGDIVLHAPEGRPLAVISVFPVLRGDDDTPSLAWLFAAERRALILVRPLAHGIVTSELRLRTVLALTPTEARVAAQLTAGRSIAEAAASIGIATNTARVHLRSVFAKTGTRRQGELVSLLAKLT